MKSVTPSSSRGFSPRPTHPSQLCASSAEGSIKQRGTTTHSTDSSASSKPVRLASHKHAAADNTKGPHGWEERHETLQQLDEFDMRNKCHLVFTMPSRQKKTCTESVEDLGAAIKKAACGVSDMRAIGLSGLRLTGDHEHEYQFLQSDEHLSKPAAPPAVSMKHSSNSSRPRSAGTKGSARPFLRLRVAECATVRTEAANVGVARPPQIAASATVHNPSASSLDKFPVPSLEDLRSFCGEVETSSNRALSGSASHMPVSALVHPRVRQVRVFPAPLFADVPVAPHLQAIMRWCQTAERLSKDLCLQHLGHVLQTLHLRVDPSVKPKWHSAKHADDVTVSPDSRFGGESDSHPGGGFVVAAPREAEAVGGIPKMQQLLKQSKYLEKLLNRESNDDDSSSAIKHRHLDQLAGVVAVWCEFCHKDSATSSAYCLVGSMANTPSRWAQFCKIVFHDVFVTAANVDGLYKMLNDGYMDQLTFGRFITTLYMVLGPSLQALVDVSNSRLITSSATKSAVEPPTVAPRDDHALSREKSFSIFSFTQPVPLSFHAFREQQQTSSGREADDITRRFSAMFCAAAAGKGRHRDLPSSDATKVLGLWMSYAGQVLVKKCRTVNVFHLECIVNTVLTTVQFPDVSARTQHSDASGAATGGMASAKGALILENTKRPADAEMEGIIKQLRADLISFRDAVGKKIEVMLDEAVLVLSEKTDMLGRLLFSSAALDAEEELNDLIAFAVHSVKEEEKAEHSRAAAQQMQAAMHNGGSPAGHGAGTRLGGFMRKKSVSMSKHQ